MDRFLENDTVLKVVSVIVAIFLWMYVSSTTQHIVTKPVGPVAITWVPPTHSSWSVTSVSPSVVTVEVRGSPSEVSKVSAKNIQAVLNLSTLAKPGTYSMHVPVSVPRGISLTSVTPSQVVVTVVQMSKKTMSVTTHPVGNVASGYEVSSISPSAKSGTISGPIQDIAQVRNLRASVILNGQKSSFSQQDILVPVNKSGVKVKHITVSPPMINSTVHIKVIPPHRTVGIIGKISGKVAKGYRVTAILVKPSSVDITGSKSLLSTVSSLNTTPVNVSGLKRTVTESVPISFPSGVSPISIYNVTETVTIKPVG